MPVQVTYPGVYIEEIPSGVQTITGVATSITAFMGTALRGPLGTGDVGPTTIFNFGDYERIFGGLWVNSPMSYAVRDFFNNGGSQAVIVRIYEPSSGSPPGSPPSSAETAGCALISVKAPALPPASAPAGGFVLPGSPPLSPWSLHAASPGAWGNNVRVMFDTNPPNVAPAATQSYASFGVPPADMFNITIFYLAPGGTIQTERFVNLTLTDYTASGFAPSPNRVDRYLNENSQLVQMFEDDLPGAPDRTWLAGWTEFTASANHTSQTLLFQDLDPSSGGNDGNTPLQNSTTYTYGDGTTQGGFYALDKVDLFNLLCIPYDAGNSDSNPNADTQAMGAYPALAEYCQKRRAMFIVDPPSKWSVAARNNQLSTLNPTDLGIDGLIQRNAAVYFPRVVEADPLLNGQARVMPACGMIAGVMARTDSALGLWKAPAGMNASLNGPGLSLEFKLTDDQNGMLNPLGINCLRSFPVVGPVVWGARTLRGADVLEDDYKYIPVRRLTLFIEESIDRGTKWAVFEPNADPLWTSLRTAVSTFLSNLQRQGAFYSYFVKCDSTTTTVDDIALGIVNITVGIAPVKPAEFVVLQIQQTAGQTS